MTLPTMPTPDAQSPHYLSQHSPIPSSHSIPYTTQPSPAPFTPLTPIPPAPVEPATEQSRIEARRRAVDFVGNSWNLATGGLKTLTAKREIPPHLQQRSGDTYAQASEAQSQRSYTLALVILACVLVMLVSGGIILFLMLQS